MSGTQTQPREYISSQALKGDEPQIRCGNCQHLFTADQWQPRLRCPNCDVLGYPDRAGLNLLPLGWTCQHCSAHNSGSTNFCLNCATGLASHCVTCDAPVYSAACTNCGTHQAHALKITTIEADRKPWVAKQRTQFRSERLNSENVPSAAFNPNYGVAGWRSLTQPQPTLELEEGEVSPAVVSPPRTTLVVRNTIKWGARSLAVIGISAVAVAYLNRILTELVGVTLLDPVISTIESGLVGAITSVDTTIAYASLMLLVGAALIPVFVVLSRQIARRIIP